MRRNRTFAYDLIVQYGAVNSRVALLLRSIEAKPTLPPPSPVNYLIKLGVIGEELASPSRKQGSAGRVRDLDVAVQVYIQRPTYPVCLSSRSYASLRGLGEVKAIGCEQAYKGDRLGAPS
jgi:hypothetical protein